MNTSKTIVTALAALMLGISADQLSAQSVIFPQQEQPGLASLAASQGVYTLSNDLLSATFVEQEGKLEFGGCEALGLKGGTPLFRVNLGNGKSFTSSEMTMSDVTTVSLSGDSNATRGAEKLDGKAIEAVFTKDGITVAWQAVLRDGSHYIRTHIDISTAKDVAMQSIVPMIYDVATVEGEALPAVVGNTRGAVIASDRIFAGLETPMGLNQVKSNGSVNSDFNHAEWKPADFKTMSDVPQGVKGFGIAESSILASEGYLIFNESGKYAFKFMYKSGSHRLNILGVDVLTLKGEVVASDYHTGYSGTNKVNNTYTVDIPEAGPYLVRYIVENQSESINSSGSVEVDRPVTKPVIKVGNPPAETKSIASRSALNETIDWTPASWTAISADAMPARLVEMGFSASDILAMEKAVTLDDKSTVTAEFKYLSGNHKLSTVGVDLIDEQGNAVAYDYHAGFAGDKHTDHIYTIDAPFGGKFTMRFLAQVRDETLTASGNVKISSTSGSQADNVIYVPAPESVPIEGTWERPTTLQAGKTWSVGAVVGIIAPGQARRSFLAYNERERAVPWRPFPMYNSWYELNIDRNNAPAPDYKGNFTIEQCVDVINQWRTNLYQKYNTNIQAFVYDDGWDSYGTWGFNPNFPNGFSEADAAARAMNTGIGTWLGPVGGYGGSGTYRRKYWTDKGQAMRLSNPEYNKVFYDACVKMIHDYDFRFFKFDGISAQWSALGPDGGAEGIENAEGIIDIEARIREAKPDIFLNTTVGTWASPFWFQYTDAVWRQENDWSKIGNGKDDREQWITYRDRLVYQNFVQNSPLCPINNMMTHGLIVTTHGNVSKTMNYAGILREMRCAFACGSSMVELYVDYERFNTINKGKLWSDLADCIKWQEEYADVLPDIHWVGGNPWNGSTHEIYGWAAWNGDRAVLTLRNGGTKKATITTTLREALDIPDYWNSTVTLSSAFADQKFTSVHGLPLDEPIDIDTPLTIELPASSVYVLNGRDSSSGIGEITTDSRETPEGTYDLQGRPTGSDAKGIVIRNGKKIYVK